MRPPLDILDIHRPGDLDEALSLLSRYKDQAAVIAGGTDLLPLRQGCRTFVRHPHLIDVSQTGMNYVREGRDAVCIGAATDIRTLADSGLFQSGGYRVLADAALAHSTPTLRNRATIGGNLCNASPCADLAPALLVLDAELVISDIHGKRVLPLTDFFTGPHCTVLASIEILTEIRIPRIQEPLGSGFIKLRRQHTAVDMALVNAAAAIRVKDGICERARIALGSAGPVPFRAKAAEALLQGRAVTGDAVRAAALRAAEESCPIDDNRASAAYRKQMIPVLVRQSLELGLERSLT